MQQTKKRIGTILLGACLFVALMFAGITAYAAESWQGAAFGDSLTVNATSNEEMKEDIAKANVVVDVYRVAKAEKDATFDVYNYTWEAPFGTGAIDTTGLDSEGWQELADAAAKVLGTSGTAIDHVTAKAGETINGIDDGIYLIVAHGADVNVAFKDNGAIDLHAYSEKYDYTFMPVFVAVPSKAAGPDGTIHTDEASGPWLADVEVTIKPGRDPKNTPPGNNNPPRTTVKTGDDTNLVPFYIAMAISGVALLCLGIFSVRARKRDKDNAGNSAQ